ncbi:hypothetical protein [Paraburkholderia ginsengisoli]|uniref:Uncharacterized protein n=1 Tax=Paraburkholderia ginsengisoli TaxID=311231 RepID=A0A7T4N8V9_9BURK|nr:hypothetical protein [Paraburkholderia ginsengisoli]QQC67362.1 hypothetical protein I6I06_20675 [Paraburkholderia ginsengisoli]
MNAGIAHTRFTHFSSDPTRSAYDAKPVARMVERRVARVVRTPRRALLLSLAAMLALCVADAHAQDSGMLDERVTQQSIGETICRPGYADAVAPPFDEWMTQKDQMLAERGIDTGDGAAFALDRRVPLILGGSPDAPANLDLLPWAGREGERRKARAAVMLKRCVCEGKLSLAQAQATILGKWSAIYSGFGQTSCDVSGLDVVAGDNDGRGAERDGAR